MRINWMQLVPHFNPLNQIFYSLIQLMLDDTTYFQVIITIYSRLQLPEERVRGLWDLVSDLRSLRGPGQAQDGSGAASRVSSCIR